MRNIALLAFISVVILSPVFVHGLDFSADMVSTGREGSMSGKVFVSADKIRTEMAGMITIVRSDKKVTWVIMPSENMYMEQAFAPRVAASVSDKVEGEIERIALGKENIDGRVTDKFKVTYSSNGVTESMFQWIDEATSIPLKTEFEDGSWSVEYRNLNTNTQDQSLFDVPAGYTKFAMPNMADMAKEMMK